MYRVLIFTIYHILHNINSPFDAFAKIEQEQQNYDRNRKLIDLSLIPPELEAKIYDEFNELKVAHRSKILNYFITRKLKTLIEVIDEF